MEENKMEQKDTCQCKKCGLGKKLDTFFEISARGSTIKTEIIAGLTTFFAMCYIIITNPNQMIGFSFAYPGMGTVWNAVFVGGIIAAVIGTTLMAFLAKMPLAQAAGMGLNSFFFVSFMLPAILSGGNAITNYGAGLVIILISGLIFLILSATGARQFIAKALPDSLKKAIPAGIGLFIAFIGFQWSGMIVNNDYVLVGFANMTGWATAGPVIAAFVGLMIIGILGKFNVKGNIILGVLASTVLYYLFTWTAPTWNWQSIGQAFSDFGTVGITSIFKASSWTTAFDGVTFGGIFSVIMLIVTFCLVDMFDTIGTLYGTCTEADLLDKNGDPVNMNKSMLCDSIATVSGAVLGTSTVTTYVESSAGVSAGGRTGLASIVTSICFVICLFLTPLAQIIPQAAAAPALIYVGVLMLKSFKNVDMTDMRSAIPAFLALIMMPLTYSISNGIGVGAIAYVILTLCTGKYTKKDIVVTIIAALFALRFALVVM